MDDGLVCVHTNDKNYSLKPESQVRASTIDYSASVKHSVKMNDVSISKRVWSGDEIVYWKMETDYPYIEGVKLEEKICKLALLETSIRTNLVIRQRKKPSADAQLLINWFGKKDESYFKGGGILAFGYGPSGGIGGDVTMNADYPWGLKGELINGADFEDRFNREVEHEENTFKIYDALHTMKHEAGGHAIGMPHVTALQYRYTALLAPYYNGLRRFGKADLHLLFQLYDKASINHRIQETLLARIGRGVMS